MKTRATGFTIIELLVIIGVSTILLTLGTLATTNLLRQDQFYSYLTDIKAYLYSAQGQSLNHIPTGIYFTTDRYIIFKGSSYNPVNPQNQEYLLPPNINISLIHLPNQSVTYDPVSGYVLNFTEPNDLTLTDHDTHKVYLININQLGTVDIQ